MSQEPKRDDVFYWMNDYTERNQQMVSYEIGKSVYLPELNDSDLEKIVYNTVEHIDCNGNIKKEKLKFYFYKDLRMRIEIDSINNEQAIFKCESLL